MNKYLAWLPAFIVLGALTYKPVKETMETKLVNKSISFAVYKSSPYTSGIYKSTSAQIHIIIEKVNTGGKHTIVWDTTLDAKSLSQYPSMENALRQKVTVSRVNEKRDHLVVYYTLTYNSNGSELQMQDRTV